MTSRLFSSGSELAQLDFGRMAYEIGIDHARFNLRRPRAKDVPHDFLRGFDSYKGKKKGRQSWAVRKWLALRLSAIKRNLILADNVTPQLLSEIRVERCPITLLTLTSGEGIETDISIDRVISQGAYAQGNLVAMSVRANEAKGDFTFYEIRDIAESGKQHGRLTAKEWARMTSLMFGNQMHIDERLELICPLCTVVPPHTYSTLTQTFQNDILHEALEKTALTTPRWRILTYEAIGTTTPYDRIYQTLKYELANTDYHYDAWYSINSFSLYLEWLAEMNPYLAAKSKMMPKDLTTAIYYHAHYHEAWSLPSNGRLAPTATNQTVVNKSQRSR